MDPAGRDPDSLAAVQRQLQEYFAGERQSFELPLALSGTEFQRAVWTALQELPYGTVTTYGELARQLGLRDSDVSGVRSVNAAQKVGWAVAATPTPIIVPCHRVVGSDGSLRGYRGGLEVKRALLDFESATSGRAGFWPHAGQLALL
jgi:methylated-DNA-[protein]-cysteine S-methyltransferase